MDEKKRILIINDEMDKIKTLTLLLKKKYSLVGDVVSTLHIPEKLDIVGAMDIEVALRNVKEYEPDLVILDVGIPKGTAGGIDIIYKGLRDDKDYGYQEKPVLFITAYDTPNIKQRLEGLKNDGTHINDYILKLDSKTLFDKINELMTKT